MDTRVVIDRNKFKTLDAMEMFRCIQPEPLAKICGKVGGGDQKLKELLISQLTQGQQSVFMFMVIYFHNVVGWYLFFVWFFK